MFVTMDLAPLTAEEIFLMEYGHLLPWIGAAVIAVAAVAAVLIIKAVKKNKK